MRKTVVILGMHRSGTSMIAGILDCLGVDLGEDQPGKQWSNPLGHFEDADFLSLNKNILASAGGSWDHPPKKSAIIAQREKFRSSIAELIDRQSKDGIESPWGWKDPRTSLTIDLFLPFLHNPMVIWCRRNHKAVSGSLLKRNQIQIPNGLELIRYYEGQIRDFLIQHPEIPVLELDYDEVIEAPERWINELILFLQLTPKQDVVKHAKELVLSPNRLWKEKKIIRFNRFITAPIRFLRRFYKKST